MYIKHFSEILSQHMRSACLNCSSCFWYECLTSRSKISSSEFLTFALMSFNNRNTKKFLICLFIAIQHLVNSFFCFFLSNMSRVSFLPEKFSCPYKWSWMLKLPSYNIGPLVDEYGKISVRLHPIGKCRIHDCFTCWSDCHVFL